MEHSRTGALEGLRGGRRPGGGGTSAMELQRYWHQLGRSRLLRLPGEQLKRLFGGIVVHFDPGRR